jgi:murein L,D-transpeptidase YcbB/YkuD
MTTGALPPAPLGFDQEIAERLAAGGNLANPEREDRAALARFYEARLQLLVWTGATGFTPAAEAAIAELRRAGEWGLDPAAFQVPSLPTTGAALPRAQRADAEIALGLAILKYARHARGGRAEPATLSRYLDRALSYRDPYQVIDEAAKAEKPDAYLRSLHPQHPQFGALRQKYVALLRGESVTPADQPAPEEKKGAAKRAASAADPSNLRQRLLVNMEAWRWMPDDLGDVHVWINIPEFTLRVVKAGQVVLTERVVVGKPDTQTPVFSNAMEQVIFHPSWGVPESIKREDVLPSLVRGSTRLFTHYKLRIQRGGRDIDPASVDWSTADIRQYHVYQPPGDTNVLGVVKFRFPNKHDVYMHDTPTKNLFNASVRAYSHGCVRVREPQRLAEVLLAEDQSWPASRVASAMGVGGPQNNQINLTTKFPVHMAYFTAVVEDDGKLKLVPDIYGHESKIALGIEGKAHLIPRSKENGPIRAEAIGHLADTTAAGGGSTMRSKKEWINRAFENN